MRSAGQSPADRGIGVERETLERPERIRLHDRALRGVDREEVRVRTERRRAEEAARREPERASRPDAALNAKPVRRHPGTTTPASSIAASAGSAVMK